ncbi:hypothetical protein NE865_16088 [Phthorimaea operculella]|nr:hypothetical protein NE865_16088 [Phthorimaea operculella]
MPYMCITNERKRISAILPDPEDEDKDSEVAVLDSEDTNAMIADIRRQVADLRRQIESTIQKEIQRSLKFYSDKIDDFQENIDQFEAKLKVAQNQLQDANNNMKNMKLKNDLLEQKVNLLEQQQLENKLEICGLPKEDGENIMDITRAVCSKLELDSNQVKLAYRKETRKSSKNTKNDVIMVTLQEGFRDRWLDAAKSTRITGNDVGRSGNTSQVYLREALSPATSFLLWKAKTDLKEPKHFKYVWCKRGTVLARKDDNDKIYILRSVSDIEKLLQIVVGKGHGNVK